MFKFLKSANGQTASDLKVYNTETRSLEIFEPMQKREVKMYSCGPTVYDYAHIGNLRAYVFVDILKRVLLINGYSVNNTINLTDFGHLTSDADSGDDKMMKGLRREGLPITLENMLTLANRYITAFKEDMETLNNLPPTQYSRASDYIKEQIKLIETLDEKGYTYETSDGVYFDVSKFPTYGRLGNINIDALQSGCRVEENPEKKHPADFAVWKKGDLGWESKWGTGFPGWHIECSAMAFATLGKQIDIHTGGVDHISTHHNGEIAQSEAATGKRFAKYWMHNEHLQINDSKISKSEGNAIYLADLKKQGFSGEDYRYWLLTSHYRTQVNVNLEALNGAKQALNRLQRLIYIDWTDAKGKLNEQYYKQFISAVNDDLDTPKAIALIWQLVKDDDVSDGEKKITIQECDAVLGLGLSLSNKEGSEKLGYLDEDELPSEVQELVTKREVSRANADWTEADKLREQIEALGYNVVDNATGSTITKK